MNEGKLIYDLVVFLSAKDIYTCINIYYNLIIVLLVLNHNIFG